MGQQQQQLIPTSLSIKVRTGTTSFPPHRIYRSTTSQLDRWGVNGNVPGPHCRACWDVYSLPPIQTRLILVGIEGDRFHIT